MSALPPLDGRAPAKRRVDYRPPAFLVDKVVLELDLDPAATEVKATLTFRRNPAAVGSTLTLNGTAFTIVGVAPAGFRGVQLLGSPNFWVPTAMHRTVLFGLGSEFFASRRAVSVGVVGRLKPGITIEQANASLVPIAQELAKTYPQDNAGRSVRVLPLDF